MKKKKVLLISGGLLTLIIVISTIFIVNKNNSNNEIVMQNKKEINNSFLTLMLEQSDGTYAESTSNTWPGEGYIFNKELSSCQNGGELDYDSENNKVILYNNKSDGCYVYFDLYNKPTINSVNLGEVTNNSITITVSATNGTNPISNYYYIINDETPVSTTINTYTFSNLDSGTTYTIKVYVVDSSGYQSEISSLIVETEDSILLADWVISQYNGIQGNNGIYYHTSSLANSAGDNSYRYSGSNPNNYVCFGLTASTCPSDNLYRIIGVFGDEVKLIKNDSIGNYLWDADQIDYNNISNISNKNNEFSVVQLNGILAAPEPDSGGSNNWSQADLNYYLNNDYYLDTIDSIWYDKITTHDWKIVVESVANLIQSTAPMAYNYEVGLNSSSITYNAKIGLMYVSDYYYGATNTYWTYPGYNLSGNDYSQATGSNWLDLGSYEWTISGCSDTSGSVFRAFGVTNVGSLADTYVNTNVRAARPVFYLASSTQYVSGSGTQSDPIRIN